ncbi:MAG: cation:proton antiporter [Planctomycetota bacterium]
MDVASFVVIVGLVGVVIVVAALLSGVIERTAFPQVLVFLLLGAALGPAGLKILDLGLTSPAVHIIATLSLVLVLFTDAVSLDLSEVRKHASLALLVLGPGTILCAGLIAVLAWLLLHLSPLQATITGAALASTDPVLLRGLLLRRDVPTSARLGLRLESGLNDVVLLPIVVAAIACAGTQAGGGSNVAWGRLLLELFVLGPGAGCAVGLVAVLALDRVRKRLGVRRDYESLYALGVAFTAYAAAEMLHGSGFLAAFAAGITITALDVELCDCFLEYGETTAEMALLLTFVVLGSSLFWSGFTVLCGATLVFAAAALLVRPIALTASLTSLHLERSSRRLIAWFGPRGLSSLLLVLLAVFAGVPGSERLFSICCLVVLLSVLLHGGWPMWLAWSRRPRAGVTPAPPPASDPRLGIDQLEQLRQSGQPVIVLDARTERSYAASDASAAGALRLAPDDVPRRARELGLDRDAWLVAFCA